jgi:hypothetical protein
MFVKICQFFVPSRICTPKGCSVYRPRIPQPAFAGGCCTPSPGITYYLPTATRRCRIRDRVLIAHIPLFTGYVFLHGDRDRRVAALSTNRIVRCLEVVDQDGFWGDLRQVHQLLACGRPVSPESTLVPGTPVEVVNGPLSGVTGTILRHASGNRFVVRVDFIQQGASVLIDDFAVVPIGRPANGI